MEDDDGYLLLAELVRATCGGCGCQEVNVTVVFRKLLNKSWLVVRAWVRLLGVMLRIFERHGIGELVKARWILGADPKVVVWHCRG